MSGWFTSSSWSENTWLTPNASPAARADSALRGNPTIALPATDKVIGNLLGSFSAWDSNPIPSSLFVIDEDMRTRTLTSRLSFESHSIATGRVANLSGHPFFAAALRAFSIWNDRLCSAARAHLVGLPDKLVSP